MRLLRQGQYPLRAELHPAHHREAQGGNDDNGHQGGKHLHHARNAQQGHHAQQYHEHSRRQSRRHGQKLLHGRAYPGGHDDDHTQKEYIQDHPGEAPQNRHIPRNHDLLHIFRPRELQKPHHHNAESHQQPAGYQQPHISLHTELAEKLP